MENLEKVRAILKCRQREIFNFQIFGGLNFEVSFGLGEVCFKVDKKFNMASENIKNKKILIGVTAGIAIYKICSLVRLFLKNGAQVKVVMTENATRLVSPTTFQALTNSQVYVSMFPPTDPNALDHINLAKWADIFVLAPATANTIGKIANGICDNLLTTIIVALPEKTPLIIAPAMNVNMWENPFVQENIKKLKKRKNLFIIEPAKGILAEGVVGKGRMVEIEEIFKFVKKFLQKNERRRIITVFKRNKVL